MGVEQFGRYEESGTLIVGFNGKTLNECELN